MTTNDTQHPLLDNLAFGQGELNSSPPSSFVYGGKPVDLTAWTRSENTQPAVGGKLRSTIAFADPATGLEVRFEVTRFTSYPAIEWVTRFKHTGNIDSPIIENIYALDLCIDVPGGDVTLHRLHGSTCTGTDFLPIDDKLLPGTAINIAPDGGRSSNGQFPFFNLEFSGQGLVGAIGWSGQWALTVEQTDRQVHVSAGQQTTHLKLHPGEEIRTPRILLVSWDGNDRFLGNNLLRRLLLEHYVPKLDDRPAYAPMTSMTWFTFNEGNETTERNQLDGMPAMAQAGAEGYWLDAGWFEGGWPNGAGSWVPKADAFPNGLKPLGDEAHRLGLKFVLWFEPERVTPISRVATEHPEWVMRHSDEGGWGRLFNLGNPDAAKWLSEYLSECLDAWGVDVYRNDFNIDPLPFWHAADAEDRQGIAEIRYVEGLYAMWDELRARKPGLLIDNCASGGRRIDLEMMTRSIPLWQSDTQCCGKDMPVWNQTQNAGLSQYVPIHSAGIWSLDAYNFRSIATSGYSICTALRTPESVNLAAADAAEVKSLRPYYLGDYYPLTNIGLDERHWCGWQYHRPDLGSGFVMCFRRDKSPYTVIEVALRGLEEDAHYTITNADSGAAEVLTGAEIAKTLPISIAERPGSALLLYEKMA